MSLASINRTVVGLTLFAAATVLAGCGAADPVSSQRRGIVGGQPDPGHPSVGVLKMGKTAICSATLIGRQTVLTAAHCVKGFDVDPNRLFTFATNATVVAQSSEAAQTHVYPKYSPEAGYTGDVAVLQLKQKIIGIVPSQLLTGAPSTGEALAIVGFGLESDSGDPFARVSVKKVGQNKIAQVYGGDFVFVGGGGDGVCSGDSGGPSFVMRGGAERLAGVHSTGSFQCGAYSRDIRVDVYAPWIAEKAEGDLYKGEPIDVEPPKVTLVEPADKAQVEAPLQVKVEATDDIGVVKVALLLDAREVDAKTAPPFDFELTELEPGQHQIDVIAYDADSNQAKAGASVEVLGEAAPDASVSRDAGVGSDGSPAVDDGGGGCAVGSRPAASAAWLILLAAAVVGGRRRRARGQARVRRRRRW